MVYSRGSPLDYDNWANITGDPTWKYENVLPFFKKSLDYRGEFKANGMINCCSLRNIFLGMFIVLLKLRILLYLLQKNTMDKLHMVMLELRLETGVHYMSIG